MKLKELETLLALFRLRGADDGTSIWVDTPDAYLDVVDADYDAGANTIDLKGVIR